MFSNDLNRFRVVGILEGLSLVLLLFVAMPLKYIGGLDMAVTIVGSIHGGLFVIYMLVTFYTTYRIRWSFKWLFGAVIVAVIPFGNFVLDYRLKQAFEQPVRKEAV